jgi:hypothetical protein
MNDSQALINLTCLLAQRLERISADSLWARRASGYRGALLRALEQVERQPAALNPSDLARLATLVERGFELLEHAAREY